jgi:hypothetical protein
MPGEDRNQLPIHLVAGKHNGLEASAASARDADGTLKIGLKLRSCLAGLTAIVMGKGVRPNLLPRTRLDSPDQRRRKMKWIIVFTRTNLFRVWIEPRLFVSREKLGDKSIYLLSALGEQEADRGPSRRNLRGFEEVQQAAHDIA